jgi:hypothetical protein
MSINRLFLSASSDSRAAAQQEFMLRRSEPSHGATSRTVFDKIQNFDSPIRRIVVFLDGSPFAEHAIPVA